MKNSILVVKNSIFYYFWIHVVICRKKCIKIWALCFRYHSKKYRLMQICKKNKRIILNIVKICYYICNIKKSGGSCMNATYEVKDGAVIKKYSDKEYEVLCMLEDIDIVINRTKDTLNRMEEILGNIIKENENSVVSLMFSSYIEELNSLKKIRLLNN